MTGKAKVSAADQFEFYLRCVKVPAFHVEHTFHPKRKWRFDFAWPQFLVAVEIEGLNWKPGGKSRHTTPAGYRADLEKYNAACVLGWRVLRFEQGAVKQGVALQLTEQLLVKQGWVKNA